MWKNKEGDTGNFYHEPGNNRFFDSYLKAVQPATTLYQTPFARVACANEEGFKKKSKNFVKAMYN